MLRFGFVLLITALPLLGMEAMSTRRETTKQVFDSAAEALDACQSWRLREGQFSALIPAAAPPDPSHLSLPAARWHNWRIKPQACLEQLP